MSPPHTTPYTQIHYHSKKDSKYKLSVRYSYWGGTTFKVRFLLKEQSKPDIHKLTPVVISVATDENIPDTDYTV